MLDSLAIIELWAPLIYLLWTEFDETRKIGQTYADIETEIWDLFTTIDHIMQFPYVQPNPTKNGKKSPRQMERWQKTKKTTIRNLNAIDDVWITITHVMQMYNFQINNSTKYTTSERRHSFQVYHSPYPNTKQRPIITSVTQTCDKMYK